MDEFRLMVRDHLAPALRAMGLTGSGTSYALRSPEHWVLLGLQPVSVTHSRMVFTVNLHVGRKDDWERTRVGRPDMPQTPSPNISWGEPMWWERIGALMPGGIDQWWTVTSGEPTDAVVREVIASVRDYGLPAMHAHIS